MRGKALKPERKTATAAEAGHVKGKLRSRFDPDWLRQRAGDKIFARGEPYHRDGKVVILALEPARVVAQVEGTEDYRTVLLGHGRTFDGECSCPAFDREGFCKHMVATALAANAASADDKKGGGALARIRDYLRQRSTDALVEMILDLAERDLALFGKLDLAAAAVQGDAASLEARLRKAIDDATRTRAYIEYYEASGWAAGVDAVLDTLAELAPGAHADSVVKLVTHAAGRIERATESIDDSDGHCGALLERARDIHLAACRAARPDPVELAQDLFAREMDDEQDTFHNAAGFYADVLGEAGSAEYRRLAMAAWEKLPARMGRPRARDESFFGYHRLLSILDVFAKRDGDVEARIALRAKDLSSPWDYLTLAQFCLAQGREDEALRRAEEGLWIFEDEQPDERLLLFVVERLVKAGRKSEAETHLWRAFEKAPSFELYTWIRKLCGQFACERAIKSLEAFVRAKRRVRWQSPVELLIRVMMQEKLFDDAWAVVRRHDASEGTKFALAKASEATHPREALTVYIRKVEELVNGSGNTAYEEAAKLIGRMAGLRPAAEQAAYVADIKTRFGRRRNFMKLLG